MKTLQIGRPNAKQDLFLRETHKYVAYGGARGGGKSWAVRTKAKLLALRYPGIRMLILRKTYPELKENHINILRRELNGIARYNEQKKEITFPNGSTVLFGYCANDGDADRYQGVEFDVIFIDEAANLKEEWIQRLSACCRGVNPFPKRIYYTLNPGGPSHGYFKRLFIDKIYQDGENPADYAFIQATVKDNAALMKSQPEYIRQLETLPPHLRKMWLEGSWDLYAGQFFEEFLVNPPQQKAIDLETTVEELKKQRRWCHVIEPFTIPSTWRIYRSYDFGFEKPFSCAWWAVDYDGVLYRILELYGCVKGESNMGIKWNPDQQFAEIAKMEREHPWLAGRDVIGVADPSIWDKSRGESIYEAALRHGVYFDKGDNKRIPGWMQVHYRLAFDEEGYPQMYIFKNCEAFIRTIPLLMYDEHRPEDLDTSMEDHVADETRYLCMARPIKAREIKAEQPIFSDPLNQLSGRRRHDDIRRML